MPQKPDIEVTLTPTTTSNGFVWQMSLPNAPVQGGYPVITVGQGHTALIEFTIQNPGGITFAPNPILVPPEVKGIDKPTINGTAFTFVDHNLDKGDIPYVLVFNGAPKLDPVIRNDGGGNIINNYALYLVGVAALAAVLFFVLRPMFRKRAS